MAYLSLSSELQYIQSEVGKMLPTPIGEWRRQRARSVFDRIFSHRAVWNTWKQRVKRVVKSKWIGWKRMKKE